MGVFRGCGCLNMGPLLTSDLFTSTHGKWMEMDTTSDTGIGYIGNLNPGKLKARWNAMGCHGFLISGCQE